jgi:membrane-bound metal-dependent hydrolase YbcI (DUF457 family)
MPTPVGHAAGGVAAGLFALSATRGPRPSPELLAGFALLAAIPDLDLLAGSHRSYTHSLGAVAFVGLVAWYLVRRTKSQQWSLAVALTAAYASHLLLDWLGRDSSTPPGLMMLWPFSSRFYISGADLFMEVSRRYWKLDEFIVGNFIAVGWELVVLVPFVMVAWWVSGRRVG